MLRMDKWKYITYSDGMSVPPQLFGEPPAMLIKHYTVHNAARIIHKHFISYRTIVYPGLLICLTEYVSKSLIIRINIVEIHCHPLLATQAFLADKRDNR